MTSIRKYHATNSNNAQHHRQLIPSQVPQIHNSPHNTTQTTQTTSHQHRFITQPKTSTCETAHNKYTSTSTQCHHKCHTNNQVLRLDPTQPKQYDLHEPIGTPLNNNKDANITRLYCINLNGMRLSSSGGTTNDTCRTMQHSDIDHFLVACMDCSITYHLPVSEYKYSFC